MRHGGTLLAILVTLLALPAAASAWTVAADTNGTGATLVFVGTAGGDSATVSYDNSPTNTLLDVSANNVVPTTSNLPAGCAVHPTNSGVIRCSINPFGPTGGQITQVRFDLGAGDDGALLNGVTLPGVYNGGPGADQLQGGPGADVVNGGDDNDFVRGGPGADQVNGDAGDDTLADGSLDMFLTGWQSDGSPDSITGGSGIDTVLYTGNNTAVSVSLDDQPNDGSNEGDNVHSDVENASTGLGSDTLVGNGAANTFKSSGGADTLTGGGGHDDLQSGAGQDTIHARDYVGDAVDCGTGGGPGEAEADTALLDDIDTDVNCESRAVQAADGDGDGVNGDTDCDDADPKIKPGAIEVPGNQVDENCDGIAEPSPPAPQAPQQPPPESPAPPVAPVFKASQRINVILVSGWSFSGSATIVKKLQLKPAIAGSSVVVTCKGKGCAFKKKTLAVGKAAGRLELAQLFKKRKLKPGTVIEIRVTKPAFVGKFFTLSTHAHKRPAAQTLCLPPGAAKPSACA
ncbi:MAG: hypothetical protein QOH13_1256 [Thermoleophilaceae bacterium]|nr:hypothetical protein [Thermoleophilaceae bacterium]